MNGLNWSRPVSGLLIAALTLLAACGGGGGSGGGGSSSSSTTGGGATTASLAGSWYGVYEDTNGNLGRITVVVSSTGTFTFTVTGGTINDGSGSGTIQSVANGIWGTNVAGSEGGFLVDSSFNPAYAGFVDDEFNFAVLQKGATSLPSYTTSDVNGYWNGTGVFLSGPSLALVRTFGIYVGVAYPSFSGNDTVAGGFIGSFSLTSLANGGYAGVLTQGSQASDIEVFVSADKTFAGYWACDQNGSVFPDDCGFGVIRK